MTMIVLLSITDRGDLLAIAEALRARHRELIPLDGAGLEHPALQVVDSYSSEDRELLAMNSRTYAMTAEQRQHWYARHPLHGGGDRVPLI
jgi:hypothetical protein